MPELQVRVHLQETVTHSFLMPVPTADEGAIADAAEQIFVHSTADQLRDYSCSFTDRRFLSFDLPEFDNTQADSEGWAIFNGREIQRLDEAAVFECDMAAERFVRHRAKHGSAYHQLAVQIAEAFDD